MVIFNIYVKLPEGKTIINHPLPSMGGYKPPMASIPPIMLMIGGWFLTLFDPHQTSDAWVEASLLGFWLDNGT